jgi:phosphoribosyl 1,2-cyclic phosphodiesterase
MIHSFKEHQIIYIGNLAITPFSKRHDAADPFSFMVSYDEKNIGVFTDIGSVCENLIYYFRQCHIAFLEANYDETMLMNGRYPYPLKQRIHGNYGHLSNLQALDLFVNHRTEKLSHLILSHLSNENNHPEIVNKLFSENTTHTEIIVASRKKASAFLQIPIQKSQQLVQARLFE